MHPVLKYGLTGSAIALANVFAAAALPESVTSNTLLSIVVGIAVSGVILYAASRLVGGL